MTESKKTIACKFVGSSRATENLVIVPGTTARDIIQELGLPGAGYQLSDARNLDAVFAPDDIVYARVNDGDLIYLSSAVTAGEVAWA